MKKRILTVFIAILTVLPLVFVTPKADTIQAHDTVTANYGSYTWTAQQATSSLPIDVSVGPIGLSLAINSGTAFSIDFSLKNYYSGIVSITVTANNTWSVDNVYIITGGCTIDSLPSDHAEYKKQHTFTLRVKQSNAFTFVIYGAGTTVFLGSTSCSVSPSWSVENRLDEIDHTLDTYIPGMSNSLSNIYNKIGYDGNTSTSLTADTLAYDISIIKNYIDGIEGYLSGANGYIDELEGYVDNLETYLQQLQVVSLYNIEPYQHSAWFWCSKFDSSFPRWKYGLPYMQYNLNWNNGEYTASKSFRLAQGYSYIMIFYSSKAVSVNDITLYYSATTGNVSITSYPITEISAQLYLQAFVFKNENTGFSTFEPEINQTFEMYPLYFGLTNNIPDDINTLLGREYDNTYTRLLQTIANGVGGTSYDTSQYDQYEQTMDGLNDSLRDRFNNVDDNMQTNIDTLFTPSGTAGSDGSIFEKFNFNGVNSIFTGILNGIFTSFPAFKYILLFALLLLVIGVMI